MKKEILLAILGGGTLGLVIAFGIWKGNSLLKVKKDNPANITETTTPNPSATLVTNTQEFKITLIKPQNMEVLTQNPTEISGITAPNSYVVISGEDGDIIQKSSDSGSFKADLDLLGGSNQINLSVFKDDGSMAEAKLLVAYSSQFVPSTSSSEKPQSYIGTVTDITNSIIQIKNSDGDIQQISAAENATFVDTRNDEVKTIKSTDVAIGDFIIALGYKGTNNIMSSTRIIISDAIKESTKKAVFGTVTSKEVGRITIKNQKTNESVTITPENTLQIEGVLRFSLISEGDKIIATGDFKDANVDATRILVVK
jgi:hypothetical protein